MKIPGSFKEGVLEAAGAALRIPPLGRLLASAGGRAGRKFQILAYHRVVPEADPFAIGVVTRAQFAAQLSVLSSCFRVVSLDRLIEELDAGGPAPGTVCITFDDGYRDNHDHALPLLRQYGLSATCFLSTGFIGTRRAPWHDVVLQAFKGSRRDRFDFPPAGIANEKMEGPAGRAAVAMRVLPWLKRHGPRERDALIADIVQACGAPPEPEERLMLNWDEVRALTAGGFTIGAHTVNHPILSKLSAEEMEAEVAGSRDAIEAQLRIPVRHFAYPNGQPGDFDDRTIAMVRKLGFASAVTTLPGVNEPDTSRYEWMRRQPWDTGNAFFLRMLIERLSA
jgi:peptidoglycan/xylan/chitin deacetylase (PgdA/CDA1 family)